MYAVCQFHIPGDLHQRQSAPGSLPASMFNACQHVSGVNQGAKAVKKGKRCIPGGLRQRRPGCRGLCWPAFATSAAAGGASWALRPWQAPLRGPGCSAAALPLRQCQSQVHCHLPAHLHDLHMASTETLQVAGMHGQERTVQRMLCTVAMLWQHTFAALSGLCLHVPQSVQAWNAQHASMTGLRFNQQLLVHPGAPGCLSVLMLASLPRLLPCCACARPCEADTQHIALWTPLQLSHNSMHAEA